MLHRSLIVAAAFATFLTASASPADRGRRQAKSTSDEYLNNQEDGGLDDYATKSNVFHTYYTQKRQDCQTFLRTYPDQKAPDECTACEDEFPAAQCQQWVEHGACQKSGIAIQVCARSCGTCQALPGYPALLLGCRNNGQITAKVPMCTKDMDCSAPFTRLVCAGACQVCKVPDPFAQSQVRFYNKPWMCLRDVIFAQLSRDQQYALACGCWDFNINVYAMCCGEVQALPGAPHDCNSLPPLESYTREITLTYKNCIADSECDPGFGCAYGDFPGRNSWGMDYKDPTSFSNYAHTGRCVKGLTFPRLWIKTDPTTAPSPTSPGPTTTTYPKFPPELASAPLCCVDPECSSDQACLCGTVLWGTRYFNCADPYACQGRCVAKSAASTYQG